MYSGLMLSTANCFTKREERQREETERQKEDQRRGLNLEIMMLIGDKQANMESSNVQKNVILLKILIKDASTFQIYIPVQWRWK